MLQQLKYYLDSTGHQPPAAHQLDMPAAVLIPITDNPSQPSVILTRRADHLSSHSGEVSLPGGKWEPQDENLLQTALRETREEIGLCPSQVEVLGALPIYQTWRGVNVVPFVGVVPTNAKLTPNEGELDAIFEVPLAFFLDDPRIRTDVFQRTIGHTWSPAYQFDEYEIWGFTARVLVSFLNDALDLGIGRDSSAPVKDWGSVRSLTPTA